MIDVNTARICAQVAIDAPYLMEHEAMTACKAYLDLTDPTPLTVELLVGVGGECVGDDGIRFGDLYFTICEVDGIIGVMVGEEHLPRKMWPRTVGELRQLLLRMEGQS